MKLKSLFLAAALTLLPLSQTLKADAPCFWRCTEFWCVPTDVGTVVQFHLAGLGKWELIGQSPDGSCVCEARGEIVPGGTETSLLVAPDGCVRFWLRILDVSGWPNPHVGPLGDK